MSILEIRGGVASDAFVAAGRIMQSLPDAIRSQVTGVSASTPDDVTLELGGTNTTVVWGSAEDSAMKALTLSQAMVSRPPAGVSLYDVSSPTAIVIR
jgi:cell division protein FtsQ